MLIKDEALNSPYSCLKNKIKRGERRRALDRVGAGYEVVMRVGYTFHGSAEIWTERVGASICCEEVKVAKGGEAARGVVNWRM